MLTKFSQISLQFGSFPKNIRIFFVLKKNKKIHIFVSFSTYCRRKEEEIPVFFGLSEFSLHRSFKIRLEKQKLGLF